MLSRAAILLCLLATSACTRAEPAPSDPPQQAADPAGPALHGFPLDRLRFEHNPLEPLDLPLAEPALKARGVQSHHQFTATTPQVWLLVFEFADEAALFAAVEEPTLLLPDQPPYNIASAFTGRWLLVTGFPSDKPVSPEMEAARTVFLERWSGAE